MNQFIAGDNVCIDGNIYKIQCLYKGGMGLVLKCSAAENSSSFLYQNDIAAKVFFPDQDINQIRRELQIWQTLNHPHIAKILAIGYANDYLCASMRWYKDGAITYNYMWQMGGLKSIKQMLIEICNALQYAISMNILHLDIKPANILAKGNSYQLADWGIAKFTAQKAINKVPTSGGTIPYMAPERFFSEPNEKTVDIYSLGITALEMLFGRLPFTEKTTTEMAESIIQGLIYKRIQIQCERIPRHWQNMIFSCCAVNISERPKNYDQLILLIKKLEE